MEAGFLLRRLQRGENLGLPASRPMPDVASGCHELRIVDGDENWRIVYHQAADAIVVLDVFSKKTTSTPKTVIDECRKRLALYQKVAKTSKKGGRNARR